MGCCSSTPTPSDGTPVVTQVASQQSPQPVEESHAHLLQKDDIHSGETPDTGPPPVNRAPQEQPRPVVESPANSSQEIDINSGEKAGARSGRRGRQWDHTDLSKMTNPTRSSPGTLTSELRRVLPEHFKFRILVVGKIGSGKSSLIKAVFKVDMTAAPETTDIGTEFRPADNRYLVVHECSGLGSQAGGPQNLQTILAFISSRTRSSLESSEQLHAVWICVPASDDISGGLGDDVKEILGRTTVPVVLVFTKFDEIVTNVLRDMHGGDTQQLARDKALEVYEDSCRRLFNKAPSEVPAGVFSTDSNFVDLLDNLIDTTDRFIINASVPSAQPSVQEAMQRAQPVPLAWSTALRVSQQIIIKTTIAIGRRRYWRTLWDSPHFAGQILKDCVDIIHFDIVAIWNLNDQNGYLSDKIFKAKMSHLVRDLAVSPNITNRRIKWVDYEYDGSQANVCCVMGYIVDLTVILDGIFRSAAGDTTLQNCAESILDDFKARRRSRIHSDIQNIVKETYPLQLTTEPDIFLERVGDLIKQNCVPPSVSGPH